MRNVVTKNWLKVVSILLLSVALMACQAAPAAPAEAPESTPSETPAVTEPAPAVEPAGSIILSTTTSTENSGLLEYILPDFTAKTGIDVKVVAVGTGQALQMGRDGEADVLLVHAKKDELTFVEEGHGLERFDVMYNDFVLVGPESDPAGLKANTPSDIVGAFKRIADAKATFISRGDDSGTEKKELSFWKLAELTPEGDFYISAGKGMGDVLTMADEKQGYTLTDRATYLSMKDKLQLKILVEGEDLMFNPYGVIAVNPSKNEQINAEGAQAFIKWILSDETQALIGTFGQEEFGQPLFFPDAK